MNNRKDKLYNGIQVNDFRDLIEKSTKKYSSKIAFTVRDKSKNLHDLSYTDFYNDIKQLGTALLNMGLNKSKIGIIAPDRYEWCCSYFAISASGNTIVPLDCLLPQAELENLIQRSEIEAVIFSSKYLDIVRNLFKNGTTNLKYCICMDLDSEEDGILSFNSILNTGKEQLSAGDTKFDEIKIDKDSPAIFIYTSGTTSKPKAVMLSQYNICSNITAMTTLIKNYDNDKMLLFLPLHHTLACMASFLWCYCCGFTLYFADSLKDIGKNIKEYQISGIVSVPAILDIMYRKITREIKKSGKYNQFKALCIFSNFLMSIGIDLRRVFFKQILDNLGGNLRVIIYGSAPSGKEVIKFFNTIGINMIQGYGLTETAPVVACQSDKYHNEIGSVGYPLYNELVKIEEPDENGIGEILVKGPNVMLGYYNNEEANNKAFKDGWFCTGDLGRFDKKGILYITGRKKDVIVLHNGKKVFPEEIESIINKLDDVEESMIYEVNDTKGTERICAKIVYSDNNSNMSEDQIYNKINDEIKDINKTLPLYAYIREISLTNEPLIKTTTQKIKRHEELEKIKKVS